MAETETSRDRGNEMKIAALEELLHVLERTVVEQSDRIERASRAESQLAAIVEFSDDAIITASPDGRVTTWNKGAEKLLGYTAAEAIGKPALELFVLPEDREKVSGMMREDLLAFASDSGFTRRLEWPARKKDGAAVDVSLVANGIRDERDQLVAISVIMRDITERLRAESEQRLLAAIVDGSGDAIVATGPDNGILSWNHGAEKLFGVARQNAVGRKILDFVSPQEHQRVGEMIGEMMRTVKPTSFRLRSVRSDGSPFESWVNLFPVYDASGRVNAVGAIGRDITELVRLEHQQALLATIVNASEDVIVGFSLDGRITSWNRGAENAFGVKAEGAIGSSLNLFIPAQNLGRMRELQRHVVETGEMVSFELPMPHNSGEWLVLQVNVFPIRDSSGNIIATAGIGRDITKLIALQREQALLASIVQSSDDAIISVSPEFRVMSWNKGAERLLGFTADEAIGKELTDLWVAPELKAETIEALQRDIAAFSGPADAEIVRQVEGPARRKDGTQVEVAITISGIYDRSGKLLGLSDVMRDVTERNRNLRELSILASIVNASEDAVVATGRDGGIISWNPAAERIYGFKAEEALGRGIDIFIPPDELQMELETDRRVLQTGETASYEHYPRGKNGEGGVSLVSVFPIRDAARNITGVGGIARDITALKRIEQELRDAHEYTRGLIESSIDAMVTVDGDTRITDGNQQLSRLFEVPRKELLGTLFERYFTDAEAARHAITKTFAEGYVSNLELVVKPASGREVPISFNASLFYKAGKVFGIFGVARDITKQRDAERTLRAEREYSRSLVQSSPDALLVSDAELKLTDVNERALELSGYARADLIGNRLMSLFTDPVRAQAVVEQARDQGLVHDVELWLLTKGAREIPVSLNASSFLASDLGGRKIVVALRDASEVRRAQTANSLLAAIVGATGDAMYSESNDMLVTSWNPAAEALFGYSAAEVIGRSAILLVPLDRRSELTQRIQQIRATRKAQHYETVRLRKDGTAIEVAITQSPILGAGGAVVGLSVALRDISERRRMEAELNKARDAAVEGARLKSEFLANMSHEIRTPLNSIIGMTGLLLDSSPLSAEQREFLSDVRESGDVLLGLINNILDFSKISSGKLVLEELDFDLTAELEGTVEVVAEQARRKGLELTLSIEPDVPRMLQGDTGRLRQILLNLLANAVKFTERGEVGVVVNKLSENPREAVLRFEVRDTGIGIPKNKLPLLFQPFTQVDASTRRHYGGTGLGLSIARELVERMQGTIAVSSTPGAGSIFWFTLKLAKQADAGKPASERFIAIAGTKVLVVDDHQSNRRILERQLLSWGIRPSAAAGADEALRMMRAAASTGGPYPVALLDVMMPGIDGIELARRIKADPALAATAVIFISSAGPSKEFKQVLRGVDYAGWLLKPVPESSLYGALSRVLEPAKGEAPKASPPKTPARAGGLKLPAGRKLRVLLAEDNPINQKVAVLQARKLGLEIDAVANGREAVEAVSRLPYDIILMDCQMPEMDGYDASREIRRREAQAGGRRALIVAMTAHALPGDREKCLAAGMDGYLSKPVKPEALEQELETLLAAKPPAAAQGATGATSPSATPADAATAAGTAHPDEPAARAALPSDGASGDGGPSRTPNATGSEQTPRK